MGRLRAIVGCAVFLLATATTVITAPPAAADIVVSVDPSTDLADGQPVTVTGSGFNPGSGVGSAQCSAAAAQSRSTADCDLSTSRTGTADSSGTASFAMRAQRTIETSNGTINCATAASPCIIAMADLSDYTRSSGMAVTFDPTATVPPPHVDVTPKDPLVDRQQVAVYATGFVPGEFVEVTQCPADELDNCFYGIYYSGGGQADVTGAVAVGISVRRALRTVNGRLDCASAVGACVVKARAFGGPSGTAPLTFDGSTPLPPPPAITATPATGLADRQIVAVTGTGFGGGDQVVLSQCQAGTSVENGTCASPTYRVALAAADGSFATTMQVRRFMDVYGPNKPEPDTIDCAASIDSCVLLAIDTVDYYTGATTPITFDPNAAPAPPPTITATPSADLVDGQLISVDADGFGPGFGVLVIECLAGANDASGCDLSSLSSATVDDDGHVHADVAVKRVLSLGPPPPQFAAQAEPITGTAAPAAAMFAAADVVPQSPTFDCASAPGACVVSVAFLGSTIESVSAPLTFDATVPAATASVTDSTEAPSAADSDGSGSDEVKGVSISRAPATGRGSLAATGTNIRRIVNVDIVLVLVGAVALLASRRLHRRHRAI